MKFANELYAGKIACRSKDRIIQDLNAGIYREGFFVVALCSHRGALLEAIPVESYNEDVYRLYHNPDELQVVGLAITKREAVELMQEIVLDIYKKTKSFQVSAYFTFN